MMGMIRSLTHLSRHRRIMVCLGFITLCSFVAITYSFRGVYKAQLFVHYVKENHHTDHLPEPASEHDRRRQQLETYCGPNRPTYQLPRRLNTFFSFSERHHLVYCGVQKVATSFWLRVMKLLTGKVKEKTFFHHSFLHTTGIRGYYSFTNKTQEEIGQILRSYKKFLFVRDPYSRLFSAYMDKIFMPTRRMYGIARQAVGNTSKASRESLTCELNVSFKTFLSVITKGLMWDAHWYPMHVHCSPCTVGFHFVGKMETFMRDTKFILGQVGVNLSLLTAHEASFTSDNDLRTLSDFALKNFHIAQNNDCLSSSYLCEAYRKIWISLQTRGLISKEIACAFPKDNCSYIKKDSFLKELVAAHERSGSREKRMRQREEAMLEAYYRLPRWLLQDTEKFVRDDCVIFGYNCSVAVRFPGSRLNSVNTSYFDTYG